MLAIHQNQVALSEQLHYREMVREQEEAKLVSQVGLLTNQVQSLKQIIEIMEKETARSNDTGIINDKEERQNRLIEKWRKEVFDGLLRNKRYELLIKDNLARYNKDQNELNMELKQAKNEAQLTKNKIKVLQNEASFKDENHSKG